MRHSNFDREAKDEGGCGPSPWLAAEPQSKYILPDFHFPDV